MSRREKQDINKLASLLDRRNLATLKGERAANSRLLKILYWLEVSSDPDACLNEALQSCTNTPEHRELVRESILANLERVRVFGITAGELEKMRHGRSPVILAGDHSGEQAEVDHIISLDDAPELGRELANLRLEPRSLNRAKSNRLDKEALSLGRTFVGAQVLSRERLIALAAKTKLNAPGRDKEGAFPRGAHAARSEAAPSAGGGGGSFAQIVPTDPRLIVLHVSAMLAEVEDWEHRIDSIVETAEYVRCHSVEVIERGEVRRNHAFGQLDADEAACDKLSENTARFGETVRACALRARDCVAEAAHVLNAANQTLAHWHHELGAAQNWLNRAEYREHTARGEVHRCESAVAYAESALNRAVSDLQAARNRRVYAGKDSNGNDVYRPADTSNEEAVVARAQDELASCRRQLAYARDELEAAIRERQRAERRVHACENAVYLARLAVQKAQTAGDDARRSTATAERAAEEYQRLSAISEHAADVVRRQRIAVEKLAESLNQARAFQNNVDAAFAHAHSNHNDARNRSSNGRFETQLRLERLRFFDAPIDSLPHLRT